MVSTIPRLRTSSATSRGVQWLTGRPESAGASHATATIWTICSAVKVAGVPERGESVKASTITVVRPLSLLPSASICSSLEARAHHRLHHNCTVPRLRCIWRMTWQWVAPVSRAKRILARRTRAGDWSDGGQSAPSRPVVVRSAGPWGRRRATVQQRWSYEHPFARTWPFLAHRLPCRYLYGYFCQAPLGLAPRRRSRVPCVSDV
jgi:hypothetical protein